MTQINQLTKLNLPQPLVILGAGKTGLSVLKFAQKAGYKCICYDENKSADNIIKADFNNPDLLLNAGTIIISPGIDKRLLSVKNALINNKKIINDIELFAQLNNKPIYAVTGSNGKSTVVSLLHNALINQDYHSVLIGNIGKPVLEGYFDNQFCDNQADVFVLELSSYQLEFCPSLKVDVGAILNITPDHLDRYDSYQEYIKTKLSLINKSDKVILNNGDQNLKNIDNSKIIKFGKETNNYFNNEYIYLNNKKIISLKQIYLKGSANYQNIICSSLMLQQLNHLNDVAIRSMGRFGGLDHRTKLIGLVDGVSYVDDSKATNIGATISALIGFNQPINLILGGVDKNQDFNLLIPYLNKPLIKNILLIGENNQKLINALQKNNISFIEAKFLTKALEIAKEKAEKGDLVLLSPACASFDQFVDYKQRGQVFINWVKKWL